MSQHGPDPRRVPRLVCLEKLYQMRLVLKPAQALHQSNEGIFMVSNHYVKPCVTSKSDGLDGVRALADQITDKHNAVPGGIG